MKLIVAKTVAQLQVFTKLLETTLPEYKDNTVIMLSSKDWHTHEADEFEEWMTNNHIPKSCIKFNGTHQMVLELTPEHFSILKLSFEFDYD